MMRPKIRIISKIGCIYCTKAKSYCKENGIDYEEEILNPLEDSYEEERDALVAKTNHRTFPFIFANEEFIGGYSELIQEAAKHQWIAFEISENSNDF